MTAEPDKITVKADEPFAVEIPLQVGFVTRFEYDRSVLKFVGSKTRPAALFGGAAGETLRFKALKPGEHSLSVTCVRPSDNVEGDKHNYLVCVAA